MKNQSITYKVKDYKTETQHYKFKKRLNLSGWQEREFFLNYITNPKQIIEDLKSDLEKNEEQDLIELLFIDKIKRLSSKHI